MNTKNALLVVAGLMLAWAGAASAELTMSWPGERQGVARAAVAGDTDSATETANFSASDNAQNSGYTKEKDWIHLNGGEGFKPWDAKGDLPGATRQIASDGGFQFQAGAPAGEMAMIRDLNTPVGLDSGTFSVTMWGAMGGADEPGDFAGFAVYGKDGDTYNELFRWGYSMTEQTVEWEDEPVWGDSFVYSIDKGASYVEIYPTYPQGGVDYSLTWALVDGGKMQFTLSATDSTTHGAYFSDVPVEVGTTDRVMAIAAVLSESGQYSGHGDGSEMQFDNLHVEGHEPGPTPAVPEPGTLGLLAAGLAALWRRKTKRIK